MMPRLTLLFLRVLSALTRVPGVRRTVPLHGPGGRRFHLDLRSLRVLPPLAGADDADDDADADAEDADGDADGDREDDDDDSDSDSDSDSDDDGNADADGDDGEDSEPDEDELPDNVKAILRKERKARRQAEREARRLTRQAGEKPKPKRTPKKDGERNDSDDTAPSAGVQKLRTANLLLSLQGKGYAGNRAKAVARLLDNVDYDDNDEPIDLDGALEDAAELYGDDMIAASTGDKPRPKPPKTGGSDRSQDPPSNLTAEEVKAAEQAGKTPKQWAELKSVSNLKDWEELQARRREAASK